MIAQHEDDIGKTRRTREEVAMAALVGLGLHIHHAQERMLIDRGGQVVPKVPKRQLANSLSAAEQPVGHADGLIICRDVDGQSLSYEANAVSAEFLNEDIKVDVRRGKNDLAKLEGLTSILASRPILQMQLANSCGQDIGSPAVRDQVNLLHI